MEILKCNICGKTVETAFELDFKEIYGMSKEYRQKIGLCRDCGFIFTQNPFDSERLANRYKNESKYEFDSDDILYPKESEIYKKRCERQLHFINENLSDWDSIAEVGASSGYNLSLYPDKKKIGIEPSMINCKNAKRLYGFDMFAGTFDEYCDSAEKTKSDLVFLSHTLEHIVNPCDFLKRCVEKFDNKYFFIEVPAFDVKFTDEPYGMFNEEHVNLFTLQSLNAMFNKLGYSLVRAELIYDFKARTPAGWPAISTIWERTCKDMAADAYKPPIMKSEELLRIYIYDSQEYLKQLDETIISKIPDTQRIAVWGTGPHASRMIANTSLGKKNIVMYIDSDKRKEGRIFNGRPIVPFDPDIIKRQEIEGIFICTYVYQNTIYDILKPYEKDVKIYKLYD